jgi:hypothetical protein
MISRLLVAIALVLGVVMLAPFSHAAGVSVESATRQQTEEARAAYAAAKKSYDQNKLEEALLGFTRSYDIVASPNSHLMVARTQADLGRVVEAYHEANATVAEAEAAAKTSLKYSKTLQTARALVTELRQKVGLLTVTIAGGTTVPASATLTVEDSNSSSASGRVIVSDVSKPIVVAPGRVRVTLENDNGSASAEAEIAGGGEAAVALDVPEPKPVPVPPPVPEEPVTPPVEPSNSVRIAAFAAGGVGVAGIVVFAALGALSIDRFDDLEDTCRAGSCPAGSEETIDDGKRFQVGANIGLCIGIGGVIAAVTLFLYDADDTSTGVQVVPVPDGVGIGGRF